jgi:hypothetical protein
MMDSVKRTMNEKELAYEEFLESDTPILIVYGMRGGGEGKTAALENIILNIRMNVLVHTADDLPRLFKHNSSNHIEKVIYHVVVGEDYFLEALEKRHGNSAKIVYFTN